MAIKKVRCLGHTIQIDVEEHGRKKTIWDRVKVVPYVAMVEHYKRKEPVVLIQKEMTGNPEETECLAFHGARERELRYKEKMGPLKAHHKTEREERKLARILGVDWRGYTEHVETVFRKNRRPGVRRHR